MSVKEYRAMSNVLICEDDAFLAADLSMSVEGAGHAVQGVYANARDALKAAGEETPDIAIIDLELADGHTGSGIAQTLQAMGVKVIVLSGHPNVGAGLGTVPHTYAAKPVSPEMIEFLLNPSNAPRLAERAKVAGLPQATA
jgi:ActR/RegA family two-component response regulator